MAQALTRLSASKQPTPGSVFYQPVDVMTTNRDADCAPHSRSAPLLPLTGGMRTSEHVVRLRRRARVAIAATSLLLGGVVLSAQAQPLASGMTSVKPARQLTPPHIYVRLAPSEPQRRDPFRQIWPTVDAGRPREPIRLMWTPVDTNPPGRRWPLRADPRRWPRLFANTTECTLSFNPLLRRHWWE